MAKGSILAFVICCAFAAADKVVAGPFGICSLADLQGNWQITLEGQGDLPFVQCKATSLD